ncbi:tetratricopeptide repeat protein [Aliiglaciecola sp.]|nr:tetratricopeptide repeat protein [Aliiglaciecola sp.]
MKWLVILVLSFSLLTETSGVFAKQGKSYAMSLKVFKKMEQANLLVEEKKFLEALEILNEQLEKRSSKYEKAQIHSLIGSIHYRNSDQQSAIEAFERVLQSAGGMPIVLHTQTLKTLAQLSLVMENYQQARDYCQQIISIAGETLKPMDYALLAQANYKLEDWEAALDAALKGRSLALSMEKKPDENLLLLLNAVHFELQQIDKMREVLEEMIRYYPKTSYMLYLASVYGQLDRLDKQTVLMESLYEDGRIKDASQLKNLASLYMSEKTPYKGALVLDKALRNEQLKATARNFEMLAQAWRLAAEREKAIIALGQAAELSDDGDNYLQKAYLHFDMAQWRKTSEALMLGFDKGLTKRLEGEAWLLLGMARFKMKRYEQAIQACERAKDFKKAAKHAEQWIAYISTEKRKIESMQQVLN